MAPLLSIFSVRREHRLRANSDFQRVRREGESVANKWLVLIQAPSPDSKTRFGFAVGKKIEGAVGRNRIKRRLREHLRRHLQAGKIRAGVDVVIIARTAARDADYHTLSRALDELLGRAGLWQEEQ